MSCNQIKHPDSNRVRAATSKKKHFEGRLVFYYPTSEPRPCHPTLDGPFLSSNTGLASGAIGLHRPTHSLKTGSELGEGV